MSLPIASFAGSKGVAYVSSQEGAVTVIDLETMETKGVLDIAGKGPRGLGVTGNPKADKCYSLAWEYGHSSGYQEVYKYYSEFVDLIK